MSALELPVPDWLLPFTVVSFLLALTFPLAGLTSAFARGRGRGVTRVLLLSWVVLSGIPWAIVVLWWRDLDLAVGMLSYSWLLAVPTLAIVWRRPDRRLRIAAATWFVIAGAPWILGSITG